MPDTIPTLSLLQPWATLIAIGAKRIETRSWSTLYRGPLAIHASKKPTGQRRWPCEELFNDLAEQRCDFGRLFGGPNTFDVLPFGCILAVCSLVDCRYTGDYYPLHEGAPWVKELYRTDSHETDLGDFGPNRYGWFLEDVRRLPQPVPAKGALGLWQFPIDQLGISLPGDPFQAHHQKGQSQ
jgi:activating signal cointegrator 1